MGVDALTDGRRYSEGLPNATEAGPIAVPTNGSVHVPLDLPVRNGSRHVKGGINTHSMVL